VWANRLPRLEDRTSRAPLCIGITREYQRFSLVIASGSLYKESEVGVGIADHTQTKLALKLDMAPPGTMVPS